MPTPTPQPTSTPQPIRVYVSGAVIHPDVYTLPPEARIKEAVEMAGGFTEQADQVAVNLAQPLLDGMQIFVPEVGESAGEPTAVITNPVGSPEGAAAGPAGNGLVNINSASLEELDTLPGIGPITAQKIQEYRAANGPFPDIEAIMEIDGIGEGMFNKLRERITVSN